MGLRATNKPDAEKYDIMFNAHLDTVFPEGTVAERRFKIEGDRVMGPAAPTARPVSSPSFTPSRWLARKTSIVSPSSSATTLTKK